MRTSKRAFTLIEVLAAMAVLTVMMLLLMRIFSESSKAMEKGNNIANRDAVARTAMEVIRKDIEGMVVYSNGAALKVADFSYTNYDCLFLITMNGEPEDGRSYQFVRYKVSYSKPGGKGYSTFRLYRGEADWCQLMDHTATGTNRLDPLGNVISWFKPTEDAGYFDDVLLAENVVRFDMWICTSNNHNVVSGGKDPIFSKGWDWWQSSKGSAVSAGSSQYYILPDQPPGYIDVYLQIASDDAMRQASLLYDEFERSGRTEFEELADSVLYKNSNVMIQRCVPVMGYAEYLHPLTVEKW